MDLQLSGAMLHERIEVNPEVMGGKPVIGGTRIPELILRKPAAGMSVEAILADHPRLAFHDIRAAQPIAADNYPKSRDPVIRESSG